MTHARWQAVEDTLTRYWYQPDLQAIQVQLACIAAHYITEYPPAWCMSIAPPGSAKTVILEAMKGLPNFHQIDEVTPKTFISGRIEEQPTKYADSQRAKRIRKAVASQADGTGTTNYESAIQAAKRATSSSLLNRIGPSGIITIPDFSTILQMREESRDNVFSQMRRIYDGSLRREFGTVDEMEDREWHGRITALAAVTPEVDHYHKMFHALGDRWLRVRWPRIGGLGASSFAIRHTKAVVTKLQEAVHGLMLPYVNSSIVVPEVPEGMEARLGNLSEFVCMARAHVHRDHKGEIDTDPMPESNTRLPQNFSQVLRGWTALMEGSECREEAFALVERIAWDCIPPMRRWVFNRIRNKESRYVEGQSSNAVGRAEEELIYLGLVSDAKGSDVPEVTERAAGLLMGSLPKSERLKVVSIMEST
jgi:hypothetical protein